MGGEDGAWKNLRGGGGEWCKPVRNMLHHVYKGLGGDWKIFMCELLIPDWLNLQAPSGRNWRKYIGGIDTVCKERQLYTHLHRRLILFRCFIRFRLEKSEI